jgi:hypothetical protein
MSPKEPNVDRTILLLGIIKCAGISNELAKQVEAKVLDEPW